MTIISISVPDQLLKNIETTIKEQGFANRSEIVRQALRSFIIECRKLRNLKGEITASITIIYKRVRTKDKISEIHHSHGDIISTFLHAHIDEDYCLEVIVVKGDANNFQKLINAFRTNENINQIKISILNISKKEK